MCGGGDDIRKDPQYFVFENWLAEGKNILPG